MKRLFVIIMFFALPLFAQDKTGLTAQQIMTRADSVSTPQTMISTSKQTVYFYTGRHRQFVMKTWASGGDDNILFEYLKPARVRGDKFLFLKGGDIWAYFSKTGRVRRIASSAKKSKMQGSDFSYEDISMMSSITDDYNSKMMGDAKIDGKKCYKIELTPNKKISYSKLIAYIDKKNYAMRKIEFYKKDKLLKFLVQRRFKKVKGYLIAYETIMQSVKNNTKTEITISDVRVDVKIPAKMFRRNALAK